MMAIIGFVALCLITLALVLYGIGLLYLEIGLSGRASPLPIIMLLLALVIGYFAYANAPFSILLKVSP